VQLVTAQSMMMMKGQSQRHQHAQQSGCCTTASKAQMHSTTSLPTEEKCEPTLNAYALEVSLAECLMQALQLWQRHGVLLCPELSWKPQRLPMLQILARQPGQQAV